MVQVPIQTHRRVAKSGLSDGNSKINYNWGITIILLQILVFLLVYFLLK